MSAPQEPGIDWLRRAVRLFSTSVLFCMGIALPGVGRVIAFGDAPARAGMPRRR
ncbi:hypothetical protein HMPREF1317_1443 [Schaalia georgiae F0490]|uniref:Uncharacterized protein n=1 Tax=Schaalia georgiae F0490 TaxID=1125717 RepID=J1HZ75_9ACTO|nr:hypothetical protein HMPREF1317_1443 [Schaalia georgiae F0490]